MSEKFIKRWEGKQANESLTMRIKEAIQSPGPLKPRLEMAARRLELQIAKLDQASERFSQRDKSLFAKIVEAYAKHDMDHARVFANELAEIRKMEKVIMNARLALEQIVLRLKTITELGDVLTTLAPAVSVLKSVRTGLASFLPEADHELNEIGDMLSSIIMEAGQTTGLTLNFEAANEDAQKILAEAAAIAEQRIKEKLPELPVTLPSSSERALV
ncbi:MAG: Snf7 family protein [Candidatus Bathyarchaeia archaeon]|nr:Snf7 family protein [Candidatus Bathyarchaeota archaeon]